MVRVLNIQAGADTGGQGIRLKQAFDRHAPDWTYNSVVSGRNYIGYPTDQSWAKARTLWRDADVVHLRNNFHVQQHLKAPDRPAVVHHHGTAFRTRPEPLLEQMRRRNVLGLAATLDLWLIAPEALEWLPAPYDLDWLASFKQEDTDADADDGVLRIAHAPTDRKIKSTDAFLRAVDKLRKEVLVELILIEHADWRTCLKKKARANVFYDQVQLGYGNNAIEAWGMGIPVIAGGQPPTLNEMNRRFPNPQDGLADHSLPFYPADEGAIYHALRDLADPMVRAAWAGRGRQHVQRWHDERKVVALLQDVYVDAVDRFNS